MSNCVVDTVRQFSQRVQNDRTLETISDHMRGEHIELDEEIQKYRNGESAGADGIVGEAIDVIACAADIIFTHAPDVTREQLVQIILEKCEKWERVYG